MATLGPITSETAKAGENPEPAQESGAEGGKKAEERVSIHVPSSQYGAKALAERDGTGETVIPPDTGTPPAEPEAKEAEKKKGK